MGKKKRTQKDIESGADAVKKGKMNHHIDNFSTKKSKGHDSDEEWNEYK